MEIQVYLDRTMKGLKEMRITLSLLTNEDARDLFEFETVIKEFFEKMVPKNWGSRLT